MESTTTNVGVIGAGGGGAAATYVLGRTLPGAEITVFEKSRGVFGRAAARRRDGIVYEYGANYLKDAGGRVSKLVAGTLSDGLVEVDGPVWTVDAEGTVLERPDGETRRWTYGDGITRLGKHLLDRSGATVRRETRITDVRHDGHWHLTAADGTEHGPFDALLLNPPAPQTADLLTETGVGAVDRLGEAAGEVGYKTGWTAVLGYDFALDVPYYGLASTDEEGAVGWIGREEQKPGHVPDGQSVLVVQARSAWAADRYDDPPEKNVAALAARAAEIIGDDRLVRPDWTDHQGWRYAFAHGRVRDETLREAAREGVFVTGDWVAEDARLDGALRDGLVTGETIAHSLDKAEI